MSAQEPIRALIVQIDRKITELRAHGARREREIERWQACRRELETLIGRTSADDTIVAFGPNRRKAGAR